MTRRPDLFIVGAAKSGTTSMHQYLKGHPEVFMCPRKEPRYFSPDLLSTADRDLRYPEDEARYLALFDDARDEKRVGESSVRYLFSQQAPQLIRQFEPNAYIVAMLRNPVDMLYARHQQRLADGTEDINDFEQAIAADEDRRHGRRLPLGVNPLLNVYKPRAMYAEQLVRWRDVFGSRLHVIIFDDLVDEPAAVFRRLLEFIEVDPDYAPPTFAAHNASHAARSRRLARLTKSRVPRWLASQALPRLIGDRRANAVASRYRKSPINRRRAARQPISPELRQRLEGEFASDVARLSSLLDRDLGALWFGHAGKVSAQESRAGSPS